jgi:hypothetical protein
MFFESAANSLSSQGQIGILRDNAKKKAFCNLFHVFQNVIRDHTSIFKIQKQNIHK